ncbi:alpha/beta-hydrolase [Xylaria palmicola]|nr:alpha/beta-hydrolase [Xylaria palmicola]
MSGPDLLLPRRMARGRESENTIAAPSYESFTSRFGDAFPRPRFLESDLGTTAVYELAPPPGQLATRRVLLVHGLNTPALGLLPLAAALRDADPGAHVALFDLWGHGLSSTPLAPHAAHLFHAQMLQVLVSLGWPSAHLLGYSFGGSLVARFALHNPWAVESAALLAPAGVMRRALLGAPLRALLDDPERGAASEAEAREGVLAFLEGGPLAVPADWAERSRRGEVVAEALRAWELEAHAGYPHSVLSMAREDNLFGREDDFRRFARLPHRKVVVLGEADDVCGPAELAGLGFEDVVVVPGTNHGIVRTAAKEVARIVYDMWTR